MRLNGLHICFVLSSLSRNSHLLLFFLPLFSFLALAFLCLGGQALTREYFNAPLATYLSLFCPVFFKIFFRVQNKTCLGVKKISASDMLGSAQKLHVRDMNLGWTAKAKVDLSPESNNKGSLQCVRGGRL